MEGGDGWWSRGAWMEPVERRDVCDRREATRCVTHCLSAPGVIEQPQRDMRAALSSRSEMVRVAHDDAASKCFARSVLTCALRQNSTPLSRHFRQFPIKQTSHHSLMCLHYPYTALTFHHSVTHRPPRCTNVLTMLLRTIKHAPPNRRMRSLAQRGTRSHWRVHSSGAAACELQQTC